jgi:hypothetical protein
MKTKAYPPLLVACAILSAPASAGATTFTLSDVTYSGGTLTGTFDFNAGVFSNFDIVATGAAPGGDVFNTNFNSTPTALIATNSSNSSELLVLTLFAALPTSPDTVTGGHVSCLISCPTGELPVSGGSVVAVSAVPLPAALPLFASGLGALGLLGWRRKRKAQAAI